MANPIIAAPLITYLATLFNYIFFTLDIILFIIERKKMVKTYFKCNRYKEANHFPVKFYFKEFNIHNVIKEKNLFIQYK